MAGDTAVLALDSLIDNGRIRLGGHQWLDAEATWLNRPCKRHARLHNVPGLFTGEALRSALLGHAITVHELTVARHPILQTPLKGTFDAVLETLPTKFPTRLVYDDDGVAPITITYLTRATTPRQLATTGNPSASATPVSASRPPSAGPKSYLAALLDGPTDPGVAPSPPADTHQSSAVNGDATLNPPAALSKGVD